MSDTIYDQQLMTLSPNEERVIDMNFDDVLAAGVTLASCDWTITPTKPRTGDSLTKDNETILVADPFLSRTAQLRLIGAADGHGEYRVSATITTSESPVQRKPRWFTVLIR